MNAMRTFVPSPVWANVGSCLLSIILGSNHAFAAGDSSGPVVSVLDGDTIDVRHNNRAERIRHNFVAYLFTAFHTEALRLLQMAKVSRRKIMAARYCD